MPKDPAAFLPLKADVLMILLALADRPCHGYAIIKEVDRRSGGAVRLQTGALYRDLKRLLADGLIDECPPPSTERDEDERRRYYRATKLGSAVVEAEVARMAALVRAARTRATPRRPRLA
jgi:DNA-binding PadR family transcriptional regulator